MTASRIVMIVTCAGLLAGCQTTGASVCSGWRNLNPSSSTRTFIVANDRPFAQEVAAHKEFGRAQGCWK